jgi:ATP-binding protein involved in chromosome partitioning
VRDVTYCERAAKAVIDMPIPGEGPRSVLRASAQNALKALPWITDPNIQVPFKAGAGGQGGGEGGLATVRNIVAVASGKGGVGKSTVAVNLAAALGRAGAKTGVLDADIYGPSIPTMLGIKGERPTTVDTPDGKKLLGPLEAHGIKLMSMGFLVEQDRPVIWRGPMLHGALKQFFGDVAWGELDYLIVDLPPGTGDVALTMAQNITLSGAVIVSTPQEVAMVDARKAVNMFKETGIHLLGLVENMSGEIFGEGLVREWATHQGHTFLGSVPLDVSVRLSGDAGVPAALSDDPAISGPFLALADAVAAAVTRRNIEAPPRKKISLSSPS